MEREEGEGGAESEVEEGLIIRCQYQHDSTDRGRVNFVSRKKKNPPLKWKIENRDRLAFLVIHIQIEAVIFASYVYNDKITNPESDL